MPVRLRWPPAGAARRPRLVLDDLVDPANPHHHDPERLAASLVRILAREGVPGSASRGCPVRLTRRGGRRSRPRRGAAGRAGGRRAGPGVRPGGRGGRAGDGRGPWRPAGARPPHGPAPARGRRARDPRGDGAHVRLGRRRRPLPDRLPSGPVPRPGIAQPSPPAATTSSSSSRTDEAPVLAGRLAAVGLPAGVARAARTRRRDLEERRGDRDVPARIGAGPSLLELESRQVSRAVRGELNRAHQRRIREPRPDRRRGRAPARRDRGPRRRTVGSPSSRGSVRAVAALRRAMPEASLGELADELELTARPRPARAGPDRAAGPPCRRSGRRGPPPGAEWHAVAPTPGARRAGAGAVLMMAPCDRCDRLPPTGR